jgi:uncharacterized protein (UPF0332 family)
LIEEIKKLSQLRLEKADKTLRDAGLLLSAGSHFGSINRSYYAVFYAARALLATKELDSPKHSGVISLFNQHWPKHFSPGLNKYLQKLMPERMDNNAAKVKEGSAT